MKIKFTFLLFFTLLYIGVEDANAQQLWKKIDKTSSFVQKKDIYKKKNFPSNYELMFLELKSFKSKVTLKAKTQEQIIELPNVDGGLSRFIVKESSNLAPKLAAMYPSIKSYTAQGLDDPTAVAKISLGTDGFHAVVFSGTEATLYIDPYSKNNEEYIVYSRNSLSNEDREFKCQVEESAGKELASTTLAKNANDGKLRTFRLALVCSGEYAQFHLNRQNVASSASDLVKKEAVLSAMNTSMTRINGVFEKDLAVKMEIVSNNHKVIFLDASTDNISDGNAGTMINEVQTICDAEIGSDNYDIGHIFSIGGDGLAGLGVVCVNGSKARGVTGIGSPVGDPYDIDYDAHEIGHQFGATHTQNNSCNRTASTAVEPGSGSTIMGYAGICAPNVISVGPSTGNSDDHFHTVNITQMWNTIQSSADCAATSDTNNNAPFAIAGANYSIPKSTPFVLRGSATDADGLSSLTYNWEQTDVEIATMPPEPTNTAGPTFRSLPSKASPNRYMPDLATIVAGNTSTEWEVLPSVAREMNFSFLVRDNHAGGGSTARDDMKVTVTSADAFTVTAPDTAVSWDTGTTQTITWNKGTTDAAPISCNLVNIKLSVDGGLTFPITIKANTENDGTEDIIIPDNGTTTARIMVEAADNIFYNVNTTDFTINSTTPTYIISNNSGVQNVCNINSQSAIYDLDFNFVNGYSDTVTLAATGQPAGASVSFSQNTIAADGNVTMTVSNLNGVSAQSYTIEIAGSASVNQSTDVTLNVTALSFDASVLESPADNATEIGLSETLSWAADTNATSYDVQIASDNEFNNIVSSGNVITSSYISSNLDGGTAYYWRIKPKNNCGEGSYSTVFSFTTLIPSYCASTFTDTGEHISNVTFNTIDNDSGDDLVDGYEDFTAISTNVKRGDTHEVSVTYDVAGFQDKVTVFIDWNNDYVFDTATEKYDLGNGTTSVATKTLNITVPNDARFGDTRMRVVIEYYGTGVEPTQGACDSSHASEWGETEDYTVTVDNTASIENVVFSGFNLYPNPTKGAFTLNLELLNTDKLTVQLFDVRGRMIGEKNYTNMVTNFSEKVLFENTVAGLYLVKIINGDKQTTRKLIIK